MDVIKCDNFWRSIQGSLFPRYSEILAKIARTESIFDAQAELDKGTWTRETRMIS